MANPGTIKYNNGSGWVDILHPIGSFYISSSKTSPSSLFGGTWSQVTNAAIRGASDFGYTGSDTHTLTESEMPNHTHYTESGGGFIINNASRGTDLGFNFASGTYKRYYDQQTHDAGGGASSLYRAALAQLFYLVQNRVDFLAVM